MVPLLAACANVPGSFINRNRLSPVPEPIISCMANQKDYDSVKWTIGLEFFYLRQDETDKLVNRFLKGK